MNGIEEELKEQGIPICGGTVCYSILLRSIHHISSKIL
jgi:HAD superfamily hydrolase (TIGR01450 family)